MNRLAILLISVTCLGCVSRQVEFAKEGTGVINVGPFASTETLRVQLLIQDKLDHPTQPTTFRFAPGNYPLSSAKGLRVPSGSTLIMEGARFVLSEAIAEDGQAFLLDGVSDVKMIGGEIIGMRNAWAPSVNVAGIRVMGKSQNILIKGLICRELSSNAIGVFGSAESPIHDVNLSGVEVFNCCNIYSDYLENNSGPVAGSDRSDQGGVAFYYVDGWSVESCRFKGSKSDGTHFCLSRNGRFMNSVVEGSKMGGYFLEGCENVTASGNLILDNGSRGVTIERDSRFCTLSGNVIEHSGREGLWAPDVCSVIVSGNVFVENGRKDDRERDCEIRLDETDEYATKTRNVRIEGNIFKTSPHQTATVFVGAGVVDIEINNNTYEGEAPRRN